jgi:CubicO group peptidase (beta-lactamase class C family)
MTRAVRDLVEQLLARAIDERVFPGAVWAIGDSDGTRIHGTNGLLDPAEPDLPMTSNTVFDLASLTKIIAVWAAIGSLWEDGVLSLDRPLVAYLPELAGFPLAGLTAQHLLTHTAGVPLRANLRAMYGDHPAAIERGILFERLHRPPGQAVEYTDRAALILGIVAERLSGLRLSDLSRACSWDPLGMATTCFGPLSAELIERCAPTEWDDVSGQYLKGKPHDFSARLLTTCGNAGVFSVLSDLAIFLRYMVAPDQAPQRPGFGAAWIKESLKVHTGSLSPSRGLFWHPTPIDVDADDIWGHFGFTGTAMWVAPRRGRWAVLLTNKLYYSREIGPMYDVRKAFCQFAFDG